MKGNEKKEDFMALIIVSANGTVTPPMVVLFL